VSLTLSQTILHDFLSFCPNRQGLLGLSESPTVSPASQRIVDRRASRSPSRASEVLSGSPRSSRSRGGVGIDINAEDAEGLATVENLIAMDSNRSSPYASTPISDVINTPPTGTPIYEASIVTPTTNTIRSPRERSNSTDHGLSGRSNNRRYAPTRSLPSL